MITITGLGVSEGVAMGPLRFLDNKPKDIRHEIISAVEEEVARFENARQIASSQLDALYLAALKMVGEENAAILEIQKMMLEDLDYRESVIDMISEKNVNAEYAVRITAQKFCEIFLAMDDAYMKERAADVIDVSERVQKALNPDLYMSFDLPVPAIVAANDIAPSEAVQLDKDKILGFAMVAGSAVTHTSILARSMLIPAVVGAGAELDVSLEGKSAIVDGFTGTLYVDPDESTVATMSAKQDELREKREALNLLKDRPCITLDGKKINVFVNLDNLSSLDNVVDSGAEGIGLFRTEFIYLESKVFPAEEEQFSVYKRVAERMNGKKVIIRTLDIGADKQAGYFGLPHEENPAMGMRAIRVCLLRPEIFITQLRAIYRASAFGNLAIMFPMIASVGEVEEILKITEEVKADLRRGNVPFDEKIEHGIMIETPAAVMISDELANMADFFSIGTNDLTQYTLAIDRQNTSLAGFYDPRHPAVLRMIEMAVRSAHDAGIWIGICGELGADVVLTEAFLRMGVDELSVSAGMVLPLKEKIMSLDLMRPEGR